METKRIAVNLTMTQELLDKLDEIAEKENRSRQAHIVHLIKLEVETYARSNAALTSGTE